MSPQLSTSTQMTLKSNARERKKEKRKLQKNIYSMISCTKRQKTVKLNNVLFSDGEMITTKFTVAITPGLGRSM